MPDPIIQMPEVDILPKEKLEQLFSQARKDAITRRSITLITPGRMTAQLPCSPPGSMNAEAVRGIKQILPAQPPCNVAAIAYTDLNMLMGKDRILSVQNVAAVIPFLGFLLGFGYIGHAVTIFEGHPSALAIGLQGADMLVADAAMLPFLQQDWADVADRVMREPDIFVFGRDGQVRQLVHKPPS